MSESTQNVRQISSLMYDLPPMSVVKVKKIPLYLKAERDFEIRQQQEQERLRKEALENLRRQKRIVGMKEITEHNAEVTRKRQLKLLEISQKRKQELEGIRQRQQQSNQYHRSPIPADLKLINDDSVHRLGYYNKRKSYAQEVQRLYKPKQDLQKAKEIKQRFEQLDTAH